MRALSILLLSLGLLCAVGSAQAQQSQAGVRISPMGFLDRQYMDKQRATINDIARRNFGHGLSGDKDRDLELLQRLLDRHLVRSDQTTELQAMGIVMGDLLAADLGMSWVVYEDKLGRSRALRYQLSDNYLFPATMVSRRQEAGNSSRIEDIYQKAYDIIAPLRTQLPFQ